mgnify:CR=1 FL=1
MTEVEKLRQEVAALRREIETLKAERVVHHHYHQPPQFTLPPAPFAPTARPMHPGSPFVTTCAASGVQINALGVSTYNGAIQ